MAQAPRACRPCSSGGRPVRYPRAGPAPRGRVGRHRALLGGPHDTHVRPRVLPFARVAAPRRDVRLLALALLRRDARPGLGPVRAFAAERPPTAALALP